MRTMEVTGLLIAAAAAASGAMAATPAAEVFGIANLQSQLAEGKTRVASARANGLIVMRLLVTIDTAGRVTDAVPYEDSIVPGDPAAAIAAARSWSFRPQLFDGHPVAASGIVDVTLSPPEQPRPAHRAVPCPSTITAITLTRSACFGDCPAYTVTVGRQGTVRFVAAAPAPSGLTAGVLLPGVHDARVDPGAAARLIASFRSAAFFDLAPYYRAMITDNPTQTLTVHAGAASKTVEDYVGDYAGMPPVVRALEEAVDRVADTARWTTSDAGTVPYLASINFDFASRAAAHLAITALRNARYADRPDHLSRLVLDLIDRGLPLAMPIAANEPFPSGQDRPRAGALGAQLAYEAALRGREELLERLDRLGYLRQLDRADLTAALASGAGCSPSAARTLVKAGADPTGYRRGTALTAIRTRLNVCGDADDARVVAMVRTLIELGVPADGRDDSGYTALMFANSPGFVQLLIAHGADPSARAADGLTPLLTTSDDRVALTLLRAGADPTASQNGLTVRGHASQANLPQTTAWLNAYAIE